MIASLQRFPAGMKICIAAAMLLLASAIGSSTLPALEGMIDSRAILSKAEGESARAAANTWDAEQGTLELYGKMGEEDHFVCQYLTPAPRNGKRSDRAGEAIYYFHTPGDGDPIKSGICQRLVRESGFTVFSVIFTKSSSAGGGRDPSYPGPRTDPYRRN